MRQRTILWIMLFLCLVAVTACSSTTTQGGSTPTPTAAPPSLTPTLAPAGTVIATISGLGALSQSLETGGVPYALAGSDSAVWVHNGQAGTLIRIDPQTNKIVATVSVGHGQGDVAIGQGAVWVANPTEGTVSRIDPRTNRVVATVSVATQDNVVGLTVSPGAVWMTDFVDGALIRIDPQTNQVVAALPFNSGPTGVSFGSGSVWLCNRHNSPGLWRYDPQTNQVQAKIAVGATVDAPPCGTVVALAQSVWITSFANEEPDTVALERIDPATNTLSAAIKAPGVYPFDFAADERGVWVFDPNVGLFRIDPQTNQIVGELSMAGGTGVAVGAGSVWFAKRDGTLLRITPTS